MNRILAMGTASIDTTLVDIRNYGMSPPPFLTLIKSFERKLLVSCLKRLETNRFQGSHKRPLNIYYLANSTRSIV
jgi:hypothetical protein